MTDIDIQSINNSEPTGNTFITGDIFEGLIVSEYVDNKYEISTDDEWL